MKPKAGMVALFHLVLRDPGSYYLVTQLCIVSIPKVNFWFRMFAPAPTFMIMLQSAKCTKGGKGHTSAVFVKKDPRNLPHDSSPYISV